MRQYTRSSILKLFIGQNLKYYLPSQPSQEHLLTCGLSNKLLLTESFQHPIFVGFQPTYFPRSHSHSQSSLVSRRLTPHVVIPIPPRLSRQRNSPKQLTSARSVLMHQAWPSREAEGELRPSQLRDAPPQGFLSFQTEFSCLIRQKLYFFNMRLNS